jgi:transglutaminase-like putative cysteine protease
MRVALLNILLFCTSFCSLAQGLYPVSSIPQNLKPYANAIVRNLDETIEIKDAENVIYHIKEAITILNKNGDDFARIVIGYDKGRQIKWVKGAVYNEFGLPAGKFSEREFNDVSAISNFSLYEDDRVKYYKPSVNSYPYTVEVEYEIKQRQSLVLPRWLPASSSEIAVENSSFKVICKPDLNLRIKENNFPGKLQTETVKDQKIYTWQISNIKALRDESYIPDPNTFLTSVEVVPEKFYFGGKPGSFSNWDEFSKWMTSALLKGRDQIPEQTAAYIRNLVKDIPDPKLKAKKIYEYMQQKTRYISVQIGVGGYQPTLASEVDQLGYGDCKGLVNYTRGLLKVAGIDSYYCIVYGDHNRKRSIDPTFASLQGNHIILCLPFKNDTTWLECTSKQIPFGFLGDFTSARNVLACNDLGGKLMKSPEYKTAGNLQARNCAFSIDKNGMLNGNIETRYEGEQYDNREDLTGEPYLEQIKSLQQVYAIDNLNIKSFKLKQEKTEHPVTYENISLDAPNYCTLNDDRFVVPINRVNFIKRPLKEVRNRVLPVCISHGYIDKDEIVYQLPEDYKIEERPRNVKTSTSFGSFNTKIEVKDGKVFYSRTIELNAGTYPKETYQELTDFYQTVYESDNASFTLIKK